MPQSLAKIVIHIVFSTKNHAPFLTEPIREQLFPYMAGILNKLDSKAILINGAEDHVHILCLLSRNHTVAEIIEEVKKRSSKWIKTMDQECATFQWQNGYGVFSVSQSRVSAVHNYITDQAEHHRAVTFKEEFREFLNKYQVQYDEQYLWD